MKLTERIWRRVKKTTLGVVAIVVAVALIYGIAKVISLIPLKILETLFVSNWKAVLIGAGLVVAGLIISEVLFGDDEEK